MPSSIITEKGQITIPLEILKYLGLKPQDKIIYVLDGSRIYFYKLRRRVKKEIRIEP